MIFSDFLRIFCALSHHPTKQPSNRGKASCGNFPTPGASLARVRVHEGARLDGWMVGWGVKLLIRLADQSNRDPTGFGWMVGWSLNASPNAASDGQAGAGASPCSPGLATNALTIGAIVGRLFVFPHFPLPFPRLNFSTIQQSNNWGVLCTRRPFIAGPRARTGAAQLFDCSIVGGLSI